MQRDPSEDINIISKIFGFLVGPISNIVGHLLILPFNLANQVLGTAILLFLAVTLSISLPIIFSESMSFSTNYCVLLGAIIGFILAPILSIAICINAAFDIVETLFLPLISFFKGFKEGWNIGFSSVILKGLTSPTKNFLRDMRSAFASIRRQHADMLEASQNMVRFSRLEEDQINELYVQLDSSEKAEISEKLHEKLSVNSRDELQGGIEIDADEVKVLLIKQTFIGGKWVADESSSYVSTNDFLRGQLSVNDVHPINRDKIIPSVIGSENAVRYIIAKVSDLTSSRPEAHPVVVAAADRSTVAAAAAAAAYARQRREVRI